VTLDLDVCCGSVKICQKENHFWPLPCSICHCVLEVIWISVPFGSDRVLAKIHLKGLYKRAVGTGTLSLWSFHKLVDRHFFRKWHSTLFSPSGCNINWDTNKTKTCWLSISLPHFLHLKVKYTKKKKKNTNCFSFIHHTNTNPPPPPPPPNQFT